MKLQIMFQFLNNHYHRTQRVLTPAKALEWVEEKNLNPAFCTSSDIPPRWIHLSLLRLASLPLRRLNHSAVRKLAHKFVKLGLWRALAMAKYIQTTNGTSSGWKEAVSSCLSDTCCASTVDVAESLKSDWLINFNSVPVDASRSAEALAVGSLSTAQVSG